MPFPSRVYSFIISTSLRKIAPPSVGFTSIPIVVRCISESFRATMLEGGQSDKNAFDHGVRANYREIFGPDWKLWFLPIYSRYVFLLHFSSVIRTILMLSHFPASHLLMHTAFCFNDCPASTLFCFPTLSLAPEHSARNEKLSQRNFCYVFSYGSGCVFRIRSDASYHPMACTTSTSSHTDPTACCQSARISASEMA